VPEAQVAAAAAATVWVLVLFNTVRAILHSQFGGGFEYMLRL